MTSIQLGREFLVEYNPIEERIRIQYASDNKFCGEVWVERNKVGVADRYYFLCPITRSLTTRIHLIEGRWGARSAFPHVLSKTASRQHRRAERVEEAADRLLGRNGFPKAKGKNRQRLLELVKLTPFIEFRNPELSALISEHPKRSSLERLAMQKMFPFGTRLAIIRGESISDDELHSTLALREMLQSRSPPALGRDSPLLLVEEWPSLDIRELAKAGFFKTATAGRTLVWKGWFGHDAVRALVVVDLRNVESAYLVVRAAAGDPGFVEDHLIRLQTAPHTRRHYLTCPRSGRRADILFLRDGIFGAAQSSRLIHRSQRSLAFGN